METPPGRRSAVSDDGLDFDNKYGIPELIANPLELREDATGTFRLNLVIPVISKSLTYGGVATAIRFFERLSADFAYMRIVVTHEGEPRFEAEHWPGWVIDRGGIQERSIVFLGDRTTSLPICATDVFLATFWSTALYVKHVVAQQTKRFSNATHKFIYLIQDYEPEFYQSSAQYALAEATYRNTGDTIAVFNSQQLASYFDQIGMSFADRYTYEPMLHPRLRREKAEIGPKERLIYVYARPTTLRNGFGLIVEALKLWTVRFPAAREWSLISDGDRHEDIQLSRGIVLQSRGKSELAQYAQYLSHAWVGLAFVFSLGPSYAAYDVAEFGAWVITNKWRTKDPSLKAPNIICVKDLTPAAVAEKLTWCCDQFQPGRAAVVDDLRPVFRTGEEEFPFVPDLVRSWVRPELMPKKMV